jgi:hypothetical protein
MGVKTLFHPLVAASGERTVTADLMGSNGLRNIFHLIARAGRNVEGDHGIVPFYETPRPFFIMAKRRIVYHLDAHLSNLFRKARIN